MRRAQLEAHPFKEGEPLGLGQLEIAHPDSLLHQGIAEAAHGHEGVQQPQLVIAVGRGDAEVFHHHHGVLVSKLEPRPPKPLAVELVAQDQG